MSTILQRNKNNYCMGCMGPRMVIQTTTACNGKCFFCVGRHNIPGVMDTDKVIESAIGLTEYPDVLILGGESALYPENLVRIIREIAPYKRKITVNTNGSNLECLEPVIKLLDKLIVSVMGDEETNRKITGVTPQLYMIKKFAELNPKMKLRTNCVVNNQGVHTFEQMKEYAMRMRELGFNSVKFSEMSTEDPEDENFVDLQKLLLPHCKDIHQDDTVQCGCYLEPKSLMDMFGIKTILNLTCHLKTPMKQECFSDRKYGPFFADSIYISPDGSTHKRFVSTEDKADSRGAC